MTIITQKMVRAFIEGRYWQHPIRAWRIFRAETARKNWGYKQAWEAVGQDAGWTFTMMNGSPDEATLQRTGAAMARRLVDALTITSADRVLEVGCGVARVGRELAPLVREWHGADISAPILHIARRRTAHLPNVYFHELSRTSLPFGDDSFDRAYSHLVMFHLDKEDMFGYLQELARVLVPGGLVYFDTWNLLHPQGWERFLWEREHHRDKAVKPAHRNQFATVEEVRLYVEKAGLVPLAVLNESFWLQVIAAKPGPSVDLDSLHNSLQQLEALVPHGHWYYE
ncbi:MAG: class I SAM-dependent methyltransferase [Herpetosiphonaceae bacterium]|nr:class I SAM-dependent methyltransferase [Herpetosiphonaceae bacterium]